MKSFLGGLCLAATLAVLDATVAPPAALCLVFPDLGAVAAAETVERDCIDACRNRASRRLPQ